MSKSVGSISDMEALYGPNHFSVYMIMLPNLKAYIGCTGCAPWKRFGGDYSHCGGLREDLQKFGKKNCGYYILEDGLSREVAYNRESYWIDFYDTTNIENGYNSSSGGERNFKYSERKVQKNREASIKHFADPAVREKIRMSIVHSPVICVETGIRYESARLAEMDVHVHNANILAVCKGKRHMAGGYHWQYADSDSLSLRQD